MQSQANASGAGTLAKSEFRKAILQSVLLTLITWFAGPTPSAAQKPDGGEESRGGASANPIALTLHLPRACHWRACTPR